MTIREIRARFEELERKISAVEANTEAAVDNYGRYLGRAKARLEELERRFLEHLKPAAVAAGLSPPERASLTAHEIVVELERRISSYQESCPGSIDAYESILRWIQRRRA